MATVREISISFKGTIPTQPYGGIAVELAWQAELAADEDPALVSRELFDQVRGEVIQAVLPIAQAKAANINRALGQLPKTQRETFKASLGPLQWLAAVVPEAALADEGVNTATVKAPLGQQGRAPQRGNDNGTGKETGGESVPQA